MKALVVHAGNSWESTRGFELMDVSEPVLDEKKNESDASAVIIKVHYAGVCGSDKGIWHRQAFRDQIVGSLRAEQRPYRIVGHEFFGEIIACGSNVGARYDLAAGEYVSCESHVVCNTCFQCRRGEKHVCTNEKILGISHDGAFAEYIKVPGHIVWKTDTTKIRPEIAALQEPFGNAVHAASKIDLRGNTVGIFGLGPIGLFALLVIKGFEANHIIGIEPNPKAADMARALGIDYVIPLLPIHDRPSYSHNPAVIKEVLAITGGLGVDAAFEMAGFNSSVNNAIYSTRRGGDVILFGIKSGDFVIEQYDRLIVRGLTLHAVIGRKVFQTWETTRALLEDTANGIQESLWNIVLRQGNGTILPISEYSKETFETLLIKHPKFLLQF
ncbi:alcohol dehydrogenase catalytic domain-containing protein [Candidatus Uhrbacteria bacterium]|nr:alcohol dehydrogenase catalytic domain-containing protein [Candidatus Uhrbacteria bacterium]